MTGNVLDIEDLEVRYASRGQDVVAISDLWLSLAPGQCTGLVGESGCGKSSVAMAIMRYLGGQGRISRGRIMFQGSDLARLDEPALRAIRGRRIAMIYQDASTALNPTMRIGKQMAEVLGMQGHADRTRQVLVDMLVAVGIPDPEGTLGRYPHQISGGQQQRIVIAMAFLAEPDLLILDEPTTALDVTVEAEIMSLLADMRARHATTMVFISHNLGLVRQVCDDIAVMYAGQIIEHGPTRAILGRPRHPYSRGLIGCMPRLDIGREGYQLASIPGQVPRLHAPPAHCTYFDRCQHARVGLCDQPTRLEQVSDATHVRCHRWQALEAAPLDQAKPRARDTPAPAGEPVLRLDAVSKTYELRRLFNVSARPSARVRANQAVSFTLGRGETLGIVGESGCGKSTLAHIIMGLEAPTDGHVVLLGSDVTRRLVEQRQPDHVRNVQMIFQNPDSTLNPSHTVGFILDRAVRKLGRISSRAARRAEVARLLELVRLPGEILPLTAARLSGGQKQRVAVARAFAGRPALVVADEPTSALDTSVKTAILELLLSVQRESGTSLIFISHDLAVVRYVADRIGVMYLGQLVELGGADDVFSPPYHPYTEALLGAVPTLDNTVQQRRLPLAGEVGQFTSDQRGCPFAPRCARVIAGTCESRDPPVLENHAGHLLRCHLPLAELREVPPVLQPHPERAALETIETAKVTLR